MSNSDERCTYLDCPIELSLASRTRIVEFETDKIRANWLLQSVRAKTRDRVMIYLCFLNFTFLTMTFCGFVRFYAKYLSENSAELLRKSFFVYKHLRFIEEDERERERRAGIGAELLFSAISDFQHLKN